MQSQEQRNYYAKGGGLPGMKLPLVSTVEPRQVVLPVRGSLVSEDKALNGTMQPGPGWYIYSVASTAATAALAYHGYKRNQSVGWALVWGIFGGIVWPVTLTIAFAQGFGQPSVKKNRRRSRNK